jgi:acetyl-CoA C-acetyltransferase
MREAVIVSTARTPIGKAYRGAFNDTNPTTMGGHAVKHAIDKAGIDAAEVQDIVMGAAMPHRAAGGNIARHIAIRAGIPVSAPGLTVSKFCASGLEAIAVGSYKVLNEGLNVVAAGGVESISLGQEPGVDPMVPEAWVQTPGHREGK